MGLSSDGPFLLLFGVAALLLGGSAGSSSPHSLRYVYTSVSEPGQQEPQFFSVGYVDDQHFASYDAKAKRRVPTAPWMRKVEEDEPQYWERYSHVAWKEQVFRVSLGNLAGYYNQSGGTHTWQWMYSCELRSDGSKGASWQFAYDGRDYISFDKETLTYTAADVPAQNTKRKWEADLAEKQFRKAYLEVTCIEWLQRYLEYGKETLLRTASDLWVIVACVVGVVAVFVVLAAGIAVYFKKRQNGYKAASVSDRGSNSSGTGSAVPI